MQIEANYIGPSFSFIDFALVDADKKEGILMK